MTERSTYKREQYFTLQKRLSEPRRYIQVLAGPRQTGKTTIALQAAESLSIPVHYVSADEPALHGTAWIEMQWQTARANMAREGGVFILDEAQKIPGWSETVKRLWDEDTRRKNLLKVVLLGSAPLLMQQGLSESLAGRFELIRVAHWSYSEMRDAFGWSLDEYIYYGGYPGSAGFIADRSRWSDYIVHALIETTIARDVLLMTRVDKPALLRQLFQLGCSYSGQILSYQKLVGQLQDAGNTTTLAHYLSLLDGAGMLAGVQKYSGKQIRQRSSSPKLLVRNTALMTAPGIETLKEARTSGDLWGRIVESAIGAYLLNSTAGSSMELFYWREGHKEVDFILKKGKRVICIEVKSGRKRESFTGLEAFAHAFKPYRALLVGQDGISIEKFLETPVESWFEER